MHILDFIRAHLLALPNLAKFAIALAILVVVPSLSRRFRIPAIVGLLLAGVVIVPHALQLYDEYHPVAAFFSELGKLLLMFSAGLEIDPALFEKYETSPTSSEF